MWALILKSFTQGGRWRMCLGKVQIKNSGHSYPTLHWTELRLELSIRKEAAHTKCRCLSFWLACKTTRVSLFLKGWSLMSVLSPFLNDERTQSFLAGVRSLNLSGSIISFLLYLKPEGAGVAFLLTKPADGRNICNDFWLCFLSFWAEFSLPLKDACIFQPSRPLVKHH